MRLRLHLCLIIAFSCVLTPLAAQKKTEYRKKMDKVYEYLKSSRDTLKALEILEPQLAMGSDEAQFIMGRMLYMDRSGLVDRNERKAFKLVKKSAKQNNKYAANHLGKMYKKGIGCKLNFEKAIKWFRKAHRLGGEEGAYSIGYMYLKGLGNIDQDYEQAVSWFEKSSYPMAKHWLGYCYYFGYGVTQDKAKAKEILAKNPILNSTILLINIKNNESRQADQLQQETAKSEVSKEDINLIKEISESDESESSSFTKVDNSKHLIGNWKGKFVEYDWSKTRIVKSVPISVHITNEQSSDDSVNCIVKIGDQLVETEAQYYDGSLVFDNLNVVLEHLYSDRPFANTLDYSILSGSFSTKALGDQVFLMSTLESRIEQWNEPAPPAMLVLKPSDKYQDSDITEEIIEILAQENSFIQLYPNPFQDELLISYDLEQESNVQVQIYDYMGGNFFEVANESSQAIGKHTYHYNGSNLPKGLYIVRVLVNGAPETKLILKR